MTRSPYPTREAAFTQHWLPTADPATPADTFAAANPSLLKDLYPNIWAWGPRGDIYIQQLRRLIDLFDDYAANPTRGGAFHFTNDYLPGFNMVFDKSRYSRGATKHLVREAGRQHRDLQPYNAAPAADIILPLFDAIRGHRVLPTHEHATSVGLQELLNNLTYHSLFRDIHATHNDNRRALDEWERYAAMWHFDTP